MSFSNAMNWPFGCYLDPDLYTHLFGQIGYRYGQDAAGRFFLPFARDMSYEDRAAIGRDGCNEAVSGNIYIRRNKLKKAGDVIEGHKHWFDHTSFVYKGAIQVTATLPDGRAFEHICASPYCRELFTGTHHILIRADVNHRITALLDDTEFDCVYAHRDFDGGVVQDYGGNRRGHLSRG